MERAGGTVRTGPVPTLAAAMRYERDAGTAAAVVGLAVVFGIVPHWFAGTGFLHRGWDGHSLLYLATHDVRWTLAVAATIAGPVWFWWWRRSAAGHGAAIGAVISLAASAGVALCVATADLIERPASQAPRGTYPFLIFAGLLSAAAFVLAPPPRDPAALNDLQVRGLVRRSRGRAPAKRPRPPLSPEQRRERRELAMTILVGVVTAVFVAPLWYLVDGFVEVGTYARSYSLGYLAAHDPLWAAAACATTLAPVWYWVWRRRRVPAGGSIGAVLAALGVAATVFAVAEGCVRVPPPSWWYDSNDTTITGGSYGLLAAAGVVYVFAFLIAPPPEAAVPDRPARGRASPAPAYWLAAGAMFVLVSLAYSDAPLVEPYAGPWGWGRRGPSSLAELVKTDAAWGAAAGAFALAPVLLFVWQRTAMSFGRVCGVATCAAAGFGLWAKLLDAYVDESRSVREPAWLLLPVAAAFVAAFAVAPEPRDPSADDPAEVSRLIRRHRASFAKR